jgi:hypothetical protein
MRVRQTSRHLNLSWVVHNLDESQRCSPDPKLFSQPDESKRAKKMLELEIPSFLGLDESKADKLTLEPILGCFHSLDES